MNTVMIPTIIDCDASEAKTGPCSKAKKKAIGPEFNGSPISQPPKVGPQRRLARLTTAMKIGTRVSLSEKNEPVYLDHMLPKFP